MQLFRFLIARQDLDRILYVICRNWKSWIYPFFFFFFPSLLNSVRNIENKEKEREKEKTRAATKDRERREGGWEGGSESEWVSERVRERRWEGKTGKSRYAYLQRTSLLPFYIAREPEVLPALTIRSVSIIVSKP